MPSSMLLQTLGKRRHVDMARSTPTKSRPSWTSPTINGITLTSTGTMSTEWTHCKPRPLGSKVLAANWQPRAGRESSDLRTSHGHGSCISGHCVNVWTTHGKPTQVAHHLENGWHAREAQFLKTLGIAKDHIFSSRDAGFERLIADKTTGHGVDMVTNSLSGDLEYWDPIGAYDQPWWSRDMGTRLVDG
ncbi:hypothetical protein MCOR27_004707 [Pyricularia oryzae]|nr:hypothetical protein MCOR27_004707 [Pyricularia oryzae]KAI6391500.1 hypothetical protein MCOR23_008943 [Pyricularia oryzae]KAI6454211.1 hypothetical protein MCOR22_000242 [Pyricularia oryzae]KAI6563955.1 hypothetical protein MCOR03_002688 [Pyricularia oryzae]KAI6628355.1 hypothetical protein MCOR07_001473 [Pyricularia oryzae]